jgi:hypothetical protein
MQFPESVRISVLSKGASQNSAQEVVSAATGRRIQSAACLVALLGGGIEPVVDRGWPAEARCEIATIHTRLDQYLESTHEHRRSDKMRLQARLQSTPSVAGANRARWFAKKMSIA